MLIILQKTVTADINESNSAIDWTFNGKTTSEAGAAAHRQRAHTTTTTGRRRNNEKIGIGEEQPLLAI